MELEAVNDELHGTIEELIDHDLEPRGVELQEVAVARGDRRQTRKPGREGLETILARLGDPMVVVSGDGTHLLSNAAYDALFGDDPTIVDPAGEPFTQEAAPHARAARGETFTVPFQMIASDGSVRWLEAKAQPVRVDGRRAAVLQFRDISDRSLRLLHEEFVALAAHELRTPLTALQAYVQLLSRRPEIRGQPQLAAYVETALGECKRLAGLITELTEASRLQGGRLQLNRQDVDMGRLVERVVDVSQPLTETQAVRVKVPEPVIVSGDPDRLEQVILNLVTNAITHAPTSRYIDVRLRRVGGQAELQVHDEGPGIPAEDIGHLFSRFYQVSRKRGGTERGLGLGLYIAREIVVAHGGDIRVTSSEGRGTTFTVTLPVEDPARLGTSRDGRMAAARAPRRAKPARQPAAGARRRTR